MSLAVVLANQYGIVLSADRRLTTTIINKETGVRNSFLLTDWEQKIFLTKTGHGITYTGAAFLGNGNNTSCVVQQTLAQLDEKLSIKDELLIIKQKLQSLSNGENVVLIGAEASNSRNLVVSTSLIADDLTEHTSADGTCLVYSGESDLAKKLIDMFVVDRNAFPLQESINYLRFLNRSVAGLQHYAQIKQTVSEECNVLVLQSSGAQWITAPEELH